MKNLLQILSCLFLVIVYSSCYEDIDGSTQTEIPNDPQVLIDSKVLVELADENGNLLNNYSVNINENDISVNKKIYFGKLKMVSKKNALFVFKKNNTILSILNNSLFLNQTSYIKASAFPGPEFINTSTQSTNSIAISSLGNINLQSTLYLDENLDNYEGDLTVSINSFTDASLLAQMCQVAFNFENQYLKIKPTQAFEIMLNEPNGNAVQMDGKIEVNLNAFIENQSLFHLDETEGKWELVSESISKDFNIDQTGYYVIGSSQSAEFIEGKISLQNRPVNRANLTITNETGTLQSFYSTDNGSWASFLPVDTDHELIMSDDCSLELTRFMINQNTAGNSNHNIDLETQTLGKVEIINCLGDVVVENVLLFFENSEGSKHIIPNERSEILSCYTSFNLKAIDLNSIDELSSMNWDNNINKEIKIINACNPLATDFGYLKIRDDRQVYEMTLDSSVPGQTIFSENDNKFRLKFSGDQMQDYTDQEVNLLLEDVNFGEDGYKINCFETDSGCGVNLFEVTKFDVNGEIRIYFEGEIWMQTIEPPTAGYFDIQGLIYINQ